VARAPTQRRPSQEARAASPAGDDAASGRLAARLARGRTRARPDGDASTMRRGRSLRRSWSKRKARPQPSGRSNNLPGAQTTFRALKEVFSQHGLPMSLYTDRGSHDFRTTKAGALDRGCPTPVGRALAQLGVEPIGAFSPHSPSKDGRSSERPRRGAVRSARSGRFRIVWSRNSGSPGSRRSRRPTLSSATSIRQPTTRALRLSRPARARPSRRSRASISTRSCASKRSGRSATTIASPTGP
jgi:hypothetical protein